MNRKDETFAQAVVVNGEGEYALWPAHKPLPQGWSDAGRRGSEEECLQFVREVWTDMRPLSVRARA